MNQIQLNKPQNQIKTVLENNVDTKETNQTSNKSLLKHANLWITHYLQITGTTWEIGLNMSQEVYEMLENGNNKKQSQYYIDLAIVNYYETEDNGKTLKYLQQALKWHSQNFKALALKGNVLRYLGSVQNYDKQYFVRSQNSLSKSLAINPNYLQAQMYQAFLFKSQKKVDKSKQLLESIFNKWKLSYKESYQEISAYAYGLKILEKQEEALIAYKQLIIINPKVTLVYKSIALCYYHLEQYDKSIEYFNKYFETHSDQRKKYSAVIGYCYYELKKYDLALEQYKMNLEVCPENQKWDQIRIIEHIERQTKQNQNDNE